MSSKKKSSGRRYSVNLLVKALLQVDVVANSPEEAIEKAKQVNLYGKDVQVVDGSEDVAGYDDLDMWHEVS